MKMELWGGLECTINRVANQFYSQLEKNGHLHNAHDLDLFAELGFKTLRYPFLWEQIAPTEDLLQKNSHSSNSQSGWDWARQRLEKLRHLHIRPIVGLLHHGSGPAHTNLLDPQFPQKFASYAKAFAEHFPHIDAYTPINEPLTTARFSGLYGLWFPHGKSDKAFVTALLNQCRATVLAMKAIRSVNPKAILVQTEDLGKTHSTPALAYQAKFENERRWLGYDLLCGKVDSNHVFWKDLLGFLGSEDDLDFFLENPCPPDVMGFNYYVTSERFLDEGLERYPEFTRGGNGRHTYADIEAVRVLSSGMWGVARLLEEAWERYKLPLAITECHIGCSREEQLRWLSEIWTHACQIRESGIDLRAVTVWSLLGAFDWNSLLTRSDGIYESGVFDIRSPQRRPTALAACSKSLIQTQSFAHPVLDIPGWWKRENRLLYFPTSEASVSEIHTKNNIKNKIYLTDFANSSSNKCRVLLIAGAQGKLGNAFARITESRGLARVLLGRSKLDICSEISIGEALQTIRPWAVINAAGYVNVDSAELNVDQCLRENTSGAIQLARACADMEIPLVTFSSDLVFAGEQQRPYVESDMPAPLSVFGKSKWEAEQGVLEACPQALIVRTSACFGPWDDQNFVSHVLQKLERGEPVASASDLYITPTFIPDLAHTVLDLLIDGECGIWHVSNPDVLSWSEFASFSAQMFGFPAHGLQSKSWKDLGFLAKRPVFSALTSERGIFLPSLEVAFGKWIKERF